MVWESRLCSASHNLRKRNFFEGYAGLDGKFFLNKFRLKLWSYWPLGILSLRGRILFCFVLWTSFLRFQIFLYLLVAFVQQLKWFTGYFLYSEIPCYVAFIAVHFAQKSATKHGFVVGTRHYLVLCLGFSPLSPFNIFQRQCEEAWCFNFVKIAFVVHANLCKLSIK